MKLIPIAVAFPVRESDRAALRRLADAPLPAIYADGVTRPCVACAMPLNVGPRIARSGAAVYCPLCAARLTGPDAMIRDLGNPDSKPETRCADYRPDHNGECLNCDEPADAHAPKKS
jgi:hypothetical protein